MSDQHGPYGSGVLHLPTELVVDPVTVDRLARQLEAAPDDIIGVVAPVAELPPGSSTRAHAEWRSLLPLDDATDAEPTEAHVTGAVLLRAGSEASVTTDAVTLPPGIVRTDPGAVTHRRRVEPADDHPADQEARSPFPWRPVVLFLALGTEPLARERVESVDRLLDELLDVDVEPRLAGRGTVPAPRRHRPCAPTAATVAALAPEVIVALDADALEQAPGWCTRRGTVLVDMTRSSRDGEVDGDVELVSWQIGRQPTRLRARVGPAVTAATLARLVNRLAAGPQPVPPTDAAVHAGTDHDLETAVDLRGATVAPPRRSIELRAVHPDRSGGPLLEGLADRLRRAGHLAGSTTADPSDVLLVIDPDDDLDRLTDLGPGSGAVAADPQVVDQLRARGVRAQLVPLMTPTARQEALRAAGAAPLASSGGVIGWTFLDIARPVGPVSGALAAAIVALLDDRPDLEVEIVTPDGSVPEALVDHPQVRVLPGRPDPGAQARWTAHVLTVDEDARTPSLLSLPLLEAAHAGVPTLLAPGPSRVVGGLADPRLVVDRPTSASAWAGPLQLLLDGDDRPARSAWACRTAEALECIEVTDLVIARLLGWLDREHPG